MKIQITVPHIELSKDIRFSRLAYGVWRLSEATDSSPKAVLERIHACLDQGVTTFDHADIYGDYRCETLFGDALRLDPTLKKRMQIVTKTDIMLLSKQWPSTRVKHYDTSPVHVLASVDRSLKRIGVDVIDTLLIHRPDPLMDAHALGACLDQLSDSGKIRSAGVSNFMPWDVDLLQSTMRHTLLTNQIELSLMHTDPLTNGQMAHAQQHQQALMAWSPLGGGRLFGQEDCAKRLRPALDALAKTASTDTTAVAIAWLLHHPVNVIPVLGTNDLHRIKQMHAAFQVPMDRQTWFELYTLAIGNDVP